MIKNWRRWVVLCAPMLSGAPGEKSTKGTSCVITAALKARKEAAGESAEKIKVTQAEIQKEMDKIAGTLEPGAKITKAAIEAWYAPSAPTPEALSIPQTVWAYGRWVLAIGLITGVTMQWVLWYTERTWSDLLNAR